MKVLNIYPRGNENTHISNSEIALRITTDEQPSKFKVVLEDIRYNKKIENEITASSNVLEYNVNIDLLGDNLLWKWYYIITDNNGATIESEHHYFKINDGIYVQIPQYFKEDKDFFKPLYDGIHNTNMAFIQRIMKEYLNYTIMECDLDTLSQYEKDYDLQDINAGKTEIERRGALISLKRGRGAMTVEKVRNLINAYNGDYILTEDHENYRLSIKFKNGVVTLDFLSPLRKNLIDTLPAHLLIEIGSTRDYNYKIQVTKNNYVIVFPICGETTLCTDTLNLFD